MRTFAFSIADLVGIDVGLLRIAWDTRGERLATCGADPRVIPEFTFFHSVDAWRRPGRMGSANRAGLRELRSSLYAHTRVATGLRISSLPGGHLAAPSPAGHSPRLRADRSGVGSTRHCGSPDHHPRAAPQVG